MRREKWYFSIVDIVAVLTDSTDYHTTRKYWNKLEQRLGKKENLRDHMTNLETAINTLAEAFTTELSKKNNPPLCSPVILMI